MMRMTKTLRTRFALWVAGLLFATLVTVGLLVYVALAHNLGSAIDTELRLSAAQAANAADIDDDDGELELFDGIAAAEALNSFEERGLTIRLLTPAGSLLDAVGPLSELPVQSQDLERALHGEAIYSTIVAHGQKVRIYTIPVVDDEHTGIVQSAQPLTEMQRSLDQLATALLIIVPLIVVVAGGGGYLLAARALEPIESITRAAEQISAEDLHARINLPHADDEVSRLARTFDSMIARLEAAFQRERQFTSDASHELRTPLTGMELILSVTRAEPRTPKVYEQALDDLAKEVTRLRRIVEDLLELARGTSRWQTNTEELDLAELLLDVNDTLRPRAEAKGVELSCTTPTALPTIADRDGLTRLFINLIDNAVNYTDQGTIQVLGKQDGTAIVVTIADTGSGISEEHVPHLFDRFYRGDLGHRGGGAGLGLAIAKEIAEAHNGSIAVQSKLGVGSTFTVRLPAG
jgi:heavy metal sensor kinase